MFTKKHSGNNGTAPLEIQFRENNLFYIVLSTGKLSWLSLVNYRPQSIYYSENMLNHRAEHEKKKLFFAIESFLKFTHCFDFQYKNGKKTRFCRFRRKYDLRKCNFIMY